MAWDGMGAHLHKPRDEIDHTQHHKVQAQAVDALREGIGIGVELVDDLPVEDVEDGDRGACDHSAKRTEGN